MKKGSASAMMQQERDAAESGVQSIWHDAAPSPRMLFWYTTDSLPSEYNLNILGHDTLSFRSRIIRLSLLTYASFILGEISGTNACERSKAEAEPPILEAVESTTA
uniref:Uncharacterized protein n=1 Tax=Leersia perrieri TaxID=77586 RepID=A0A0D9WBP1_9ORYZ